jgi:putative membrane protein
MANEAPDSRFLQANERTLLAWVRTGLGLLGMGFVIARFGAEGTTFGGRHELLLAAGLAVAALTPVTILVALGRYLKVHHALLENRPTPTGTGPAVFLAVAASAVAMLVLAGLVAARRLWLVAADRDGGCPRGHRRRLR